MFYVIADIDNKEAFWLTDSDYQPAQYITEAEAVAAAKEACLSVTILKAVATVKEKMTFTVTKL